MTSANGFLPLIASLGISFGLGYGLGWLLRIFFKLFLAIAGALVALGIFLEKEGVITIHWDKLYSLGNQTEVWISSVVHSTVHYLLGVPFLGSFFLGVLAGFKGKKRAVFKKLCFLSSLLLRRRKLRVAEITQRFTLIFGSFLIPSLCKEIEKERYTNTN